MNKIIVLDSGFCVLRALIELRKRGVFARPLIKKRKYWPEHIKGDKIKAHFKGREVGTADTIKGSRDQVPFHAFVMKESDYSMVVISTYGTNERNYRHQPPQVYIFLKKVRHEKHIFCNLKLYQTIFIFVTPLMTTMAKDMLQYHRNIWASKW